MLFHGWGSGCRRYLQIRRHFRRLEEAGSIPCSTDKFFAKKYPGAQPAERPKGHEGRSSPTSVRSVGAGP